MSILAKFICSSVLGWLLLCAEASSEEVTEEFISATIAADGGDITVIKRINSIPEAERASAIQLTLMMLERFYKERDSEFSRPKLLRLLTILPMLGMADDAAGRLARMIDCDDSQIRPNVFRALAELNHDAGLDAVLSRMDYLVSRLPDIDASFAGEDGRQRNADTVAFIYSVKGLLQAKSDEKRKLGLGFLDQVRKKYAGTEWGREIIASFVGEFQRLGVSLDSRDSLGVNVLKAKPSAPETLSEKPVGTAASGQISESTAARTTEPQSSVRFPIVLVAILAAGILALIVIVAVALKRRA